MRMEIQTLCQEFMYWNVCQRYSHIGYNGEWYMVVGMYYVCSIWQLLLVARQRGQNLF